MRGGGRSLAVQVRLVIMLAIKVKMMKKKVRQMRKRCWT
jgi:hypothetical protein